MATLKGIEYTEVAHKGTVALGEDNAQATRIFDVAWDDRFYFIAAMLGSVGQRGARPHLRADLPRNGLSLRLRRSLLPGRRPE